MAPHLPVSVDGSMQCEWMGGGGLQVLDKYTQEDFTTQVKWHMQVFYH